MGRIKIIKIGVAQPRNRLRRRKRIKSNKSDIQLIYLPRTAADKGPMRESAEKQSRAGKSRVGGYSRV